MNITDCRWLATLMVAALTLAPTASDAAQLVPNRLIKHANLEYARHGGKLLLLDLFVPRAATNDLPVIIWIAGEDWQSGNKSPCPILKLAKAGYAIASINYRPASEAPFPAQLHDCKAAVRWLRANADKFGLDSQNIGVYGTAAGGHLATLLATTGGVAELEGDANPGYSSQVQAACVLYPATDLAQLGSEPRFTSAGHNPVARLLGGPVAERRPLAALANPIRHASRDDAPIFIVHGRHDKVIPEMHSIRLYAALAQAGAKATLRLVDSGHGVRPNNLLAGEIQGFFYRHLQSNSFRPPQF